MPLIAQFYGIHISMFWKEHNPPHLHASYQGVEAVYDIKMAKRTRGFMPNKIDKIINKWIEEHEVELLKNWQMMIEGKGFMRIRGADE